MKNIMMTVAFTIETEKDFEDLTQAEIIGALAQRMSSLLTHWEPEAIEWCDEYEIQDTDPVCTHCNKGISWPYHNDYRCPECNRIR
jgi:tRNA(Ile2) C34 agmatinyltransferase TiaS